MNHWLGVVCRDHVRRGTERGIAQLGHGKRDGLARLAAGDWLVYYSPRTSLRAGEPLQAFTALGMVADSEIWQAHEGDFHPWRRRVDYLPDTIETPIRSLGLDLTAQPGWGVQLRRGLIRLSDDDFGRIHTAMRSQPAVVAGVSLATTHDSADDSPGLLLWQVTNRWQAAIRAALKPYDLTHVQFVLLATLTYLGTSGAVTQKALADMAATDPMMTSQVLRTLESRGLVHRPPHPSDRRARAVAVTDGGRHLANEAVTAVERCDADFFGGLGTDLPGFTAALRILRHSGPPPC